MGLPLAFIPFLDPLPIWTYTWGWAFCLAPLCFAVALVYKCIRCRDMRLVPRQTVVLFITIVLGMILTAGALAGLASILD